MANTPPMFKLETNEASLAGWTTHLKNIYHIKMLENSSPNFERWKFQLKSLKTNLLYSPKINMKPQKTTLQTTGKSSSIQNLHFGGFQNVIVLGRCNKIIIPPMPFFIVPTSPSAFLVLFSVVAPPGGLITKDSSRPLKGSPWLNHNFWFGKFPTGSNCHLNLWFPSFFW